MDGTETSSRVEPLTGASRLAAPSPCVDCVFWQEPRTVSDARRKRRWAERAERAGTGPWGRTAWDGERIQGLIQYGPAELFRRAERLPAGPPSRDAALLTCMLVFGEDPVGTGERLVLETLADLQGRDTSAVEAFAIGFTGEVARRDRFTSHHTLFDRDFLETLGFGQVRTHGQVALMRLELGRGPSLERRLWSRLASRLRHRGRPRGTGV